MIRRRADPLNQKDGRRHRHGSPHWAFETLDHAGGATVRCRRAPPHAARDTPSNTGAAATTASPRPEACGVIVRCRMSPFSSDPRLPLCISGYLADDSAKYKPSRVRLQVTCMGASLRRQHPVFHRKTYAGGHPCRMPRVDRQLFPDFQWYVGITALYLAALPEQARLRYHFQPATARKRRAQSILSAHADVRRSLSVLNTTRYRRGCMIIKCIWNISHGWPACRSARIRPGSTSQYRIHRQQYCNQDNSNPYWRSNIPTSPSMLCITNVSLSTVTTSLVNGGVARGVLLARHEQ